jgi:hypothetical protein
MQFGNSGMPIAMLEVVLPDGDVLSLCTECEMVLDITNSGPKCPKHGLVHEYFARYFGPGAIGAWLSQETYERLTGKKSPRRV